MVATFIKKHLESLPKFNLLKSAYSGFLGTKGYDERTIYLDTENKELIWIKKNKELSDNLNFDDLRKCVFNENKIIYHTDASTNLPMITFYCQPPTQKNNNISYVERDLDISFKKGNENEFNRFVNNIEKNVIFSRMQKSQAGGKIQNKNNSKKYSKKLNKRSIKSKKNNKSLKKRSNKSKKYNKTSIKRSTKSKK